jgi:hypothetical protein
MILFYDSQTIYSTQLMITNTKPEKDALSRTKVLIQNRITVSHGVLDILLLFSIIIP